MRLEFGFMYDSTAYVVAEYDPAEDVFVITDLSGSLVLPELRRRLGALANGVADGGLCTTVRLTLYPESGSFGDGYRVRIYADNLPDTDGTNSYIWLDTICEMKLTTR